MKPGENAGFPVLRVYFLGKRQRTLEVWGKTPASGMRQLAGTMRFRSIAMRHGLQNRRCTGGLTPAARQSQPAIARTGRLQTCPTEIASEQFLTMLQPCVNQPTLCHGRRLRSRYELLRPEIRGNVGTCST